jgi:hypothetical protein
MSKLAKNQSTASSVKRRPAKKSARPTGRTSKQSRIIAMLRSPDGATIAAMMKATDWQQHSVRGFLAGVVRKRLKLKLDSQAVDGKRRYRIISGPAKPTKAKHPSV